MGLLCTLVVATYRVGDQIGSGLVAFDWVAQVLNSMRAGRCAQSWQDCLPQFLDKHGCG